MRSPVIRARGHRLPAVVLPFVLLLAASFIASCGEVIREDPTPDAAAEASQTAITSPTRLPAATVLPASTPLAPDRTQLPPPTATPEPDGIRLESEIPWEIVEELRPSIVKVVTGSGSGSGIILEDSPIGRSIVVTDRNVVEAATGISVLLNDGREFDATLLEEDPLRGLSYLGICCLFTDQAANIPMVMELGVGEIIFAMGFLVDENEATVEAGYVAETSFDDETDREIVENGFSVDPGKTGGVLFTIDVSIGGILASGIESITGDDSVEGLKTGIASESIHTSLSSVQISPYLDLTPGLSTDPASISGKPLDPDATYGGVLQIAFTREGPSFSTWEETAGAGITSMHPLHNMLIQPRTWGDLEDYQNYAFFEIHPDLAEGWRVSTDGMEYIFDIRENVEWSDGTPLTCSDVKWSFDTIRYGTGLRRSPRGVHLNAIDRIDCPDEHTVVFDLNWANPAILEVIGMPHNIIRPSHVYEDTDLESLRDDLPTVTSGAFKITNWTPNERYDFERNADYWDAPLPYLDGLQLNNVTATLQIVAVRAGRLDIGLPHGYTGNGAEALIRECPSSMCTFWPRLVASSFSPAIMPHHEREPWGNPAVKQALALAIDNQKYISTVRNDWYALPTGCGFYPASSWAMPAERCGQIPGFGDVIGVTTPEEDKEQARQILANAGYGPGDLSLSLAIWQSIEGDAPAFLADLSAIGIDVEADIQDSALAYTNWSEGNFDVGVHSFWIAGIDPDMTLYEHFYSGSDQNYTRYDSLEFDILADEMSRTLDPDQRRELAWSAMELAMRDVAKIIVAHGTYIPAQNANVRGLLPALNYLAAYGPQNRYDHVWLAS